MAKISRIIYRSFVYPFIPDFLETISNTQCKFSFSGKNRRGSDDEGGETADDLKKQMTNQEWETIYKMAKVCI